MILLVAADQGDVHDQQANQSFALAGGRGGVVEQRGEVGRECADPGLLLVGQRAGPGVLGALILILGVAQLA